MKETAKALLEAWSTPTDMIFTNFRVYSNLKSLSESAVNRLGITPDKVIVNRHPDTYVIEGAGNDKDKDYVIKQINKLVPKYQKLEVSATISDTSHSVEFFITINGKRMQCHEMEDEGVIDGHKLDKAFEDIAKYIRKSSTYKTNKINKLKFISESAAANIYMIEFDSNLESCMRDQKMDIVEAVEEVATHNKIKVSECVVILTEASLDKIDLANCMNPTPEFFFAKK